MHPYLPHPGDTFKDAEAADSLSRRVDTLEVDVADLGLMEELGVVGGGGKPRRPEHKFHKHAKRTTARAVAGSSDGKGFSVVGWQQG